jgi:hypothetical protein
MAFRSGLRRYQQVLQRYANCRNHHQPQMRGGPPPAYIDNVIEDISSKLGDIKHVRSNVTQAHRLWEASDQSVETFVRTLYDVRDVVRWKADVDNRMAYFFRCVRVALGLEENPHPTSERRGRGGAAATPQERKSPAGKYAHLVRH